MPDQNRICSPGPDARSVRTASGAVLRPPADWELLPPGDAMLTRRVKAAGPVWTVQEKRGNKVFSRGVFAPSARIAQIRAEVEQERQDPAYGKRLAAGRARRAVAQQEYAEDFTAAVRQFLAFAPNHAQLADRLAVAIAAHATPVGSGTVARTQRIPIEDRAAAAVIAWLRHQTTGYDHMHIPRVRGKRREVRRMLAERSRQLLRGYRDGIPVDPALCPLHTALARPKAPAADR
jgi:hypothetical protein